MKANTVYSLSSKLFGLFCVCYGITALGLSWLTEHLVGATPCPLCQYQRIAIACITISAIIYIAKANRLAAAVLTAALLASVSIGLYHFSIQMGWIVDRCLLSPGVESREAFKVMLANSGHSCSKISWQIFNIPASIFPSIIGGTGILVQLLMQYQRRLLTSD